MNEEWYHSLVGVARGIGSANKVTRPEKKLARDKSGQFHDVEKEFLK